jgi:hypothetical protein
VQIVQPAKAHLIFGVVLLAQYRCRANWIPKARQRAGYDTATLYEFIIAYVYRSRRFLTAHVR